MKKDKLTEDPDDVAVVATVKTTQTKPSIERTPALQPQRDDGSESIDVRPASSFSPSPAAHHPRADFRGRPLQREDDVVQVCRILRTALRDQGGTWGSFSQPPPPANDVVATATDKGGNVLRVQVSRVDRAAARTVARGDQAIRRRSVGQRVTDILVAVDSQTRRNPATRNGELLLALDAIRSPEHVEPAVVDAFLTAHHSYASGLGYREIWLVGPTGEMSRRLS